MNEEKLRELLDACYAAKRITETMADLPPGMKPRHIHVIDAIYMLGQHGFEVRVGDVSKRLNITMPSVTKLINELSAMGAVQKTGAGDDKRGILLHLTNKGLNYEKRYVTDYHSAWVANMTDITAEQAEVAVSVIHSLQEAMPKGGL